MSKNRFPTQPVSQPVSSEAKPVDSSTVAVAENTTEVPALPRFKVSYQAMSDEITAPNAGDAWALFCDKHKTYPSPKLGKVEAL